MRHHLDNICNGELVQHVAAPGQRCAPGDVPPPYACLVSKLQPLMLYTSTCIENIMHVSIFLRRVEYAEKHMSTFLDCESNAVVGVFSLQQLEDVLTSLGPKRSATHCHHPSRVEKWH